MIPAGGRLLVWADGEPLQNSPGGDLHTDFQLSRNGESIGLFAPDGALVDAVTFGLQVDDLSEGRYADGGTEIQFLTVPTPRGSNASPYLVSEAGPRLEPNSILVSGTDIRFGWLSTVGNTYQLFYTDDLGLADWQPLGPARTAAVPVMSAVDDWGAGRQRFYRLVEVGDDSLMKRIAEYESAYDNIGQLKSAIGTGGESTENLGYAYDAAWNLSTRTNYGVSQAFAVNVKNELTNAVGLASRYDANGNLTNRVYDATGPKTYVYLYDDENQLIEMRTDTSATPTGSRWRTAWAYDGLGRARVRTDCIGSGSARAVFLDSISGTRGSGSLPRQVGRAARVLTEHSINHNDGMRVIQERNASNTPTVSVHARQ